MPGLESLAVAMVSEAQSVPFRTTPIVNATSVFFGSLPCVSTSGIERAPSAAGRIPSAISKSRARLRPCPSTPLCGAHVKRRDAGIDEPGQGVP